VSECRTVQVPAVNKIWNVTLPLYYVNRSVLLEIIPLTWNYIQVRSGIFSTSLPVRILTTSFPIFSRLFVQTVSLSIYNKKEITLHLWPEDKFYFLLLKSRSSHCHVISSLCWPFWGMCRAQRYFVKYIWNNSYLNCGSRWKWSMIIAVNFPI